MSSLKSTFAIKAFRDSLSVAIRHAQTDSASIVSALRHDAKAPRGVDAKSWPNTVGAVRLAYVTAQREDSAEVFNEIRASMAGDFSPAELDHFVELLHQDDATDEHTAELFRTAPERGASGPRLDEEPVWHSSTPPASTAIWTLGNKG